MTKRAILLSYSLFDLVWGILLLFSGSQYILFTNARALQQIFASWQGVGVVLIVAGLMSILALWQKKKWNFLALMAPQILIVLSSLTSVLVAIIGQQFGDGVIRGWAFILLDQWPSLSLTLLYFLAITLLVNGKE
jgi:hypothetical protein